MDISKSEARTTFEQFFLKKKKKIPISSTFKIDQGGLTLPTADDYLNITEHGKVLAAYLEYMTKVHAMRMIIVSFFSRISIFSPSFSAK